MALHLFRLAARGVFRQSLTSTSAQPPVRRGTPVRLTSAPNVWLCPTCLCPNGAFDRLAACGVVLFNRLFIPCKCGLLTDSFRFLNVLDSGFDAAACAVLPDRANSIFAAACAANEVLMGAADPAGPRLSPGLLVDEDGFFAFAMPLTPKGEFLNYKMLLR